MNQLPVSLSDCINHVKEVWEEKYLTTEVVCAIEETHIFIEEQIGKPNAVKIITKEVV